VTAGAVSRAPTGEAGFRLLAEHLPDLALFAFDSDLRIWSATGAALRAAGWGPEEFLGRRVPDVGRSDDADVVEACCRPRWPVSAAGSRRSGRRTHTGSGRSCSCPCPTNGGRCSAA
jgi:PAS domain-containing protein